MLIIKFQLSDYNQAALAVSQFAVRGFGYSRKIFYVIFCPSRLFAVFAYKLHQFDSTFHETCMFCLHFYCENLIHHEKTLVNIGYLSYTVLTLRSMNTIIQTKRLYWLTLLKHNTSDTTLKSHHFIYNLSSYERLCILVVISVHHVTRLVSLHTSSDQWD